MPLQRFEASLDTQINQLKKTIDRRDKRRKQELNSRAAEAAYLDAEAPQHKKKQGVINTTQQAQQALQDVRVLGLAPKHKCDMCQAVYGSVGELEQHLQGASHQKMVDKIENLKQQQGRQAKYADMIEVALQGAAWQQGRSHQGMRNRGQNILESSHSKRNFQATEQNSEEKRPPKKLKLKLVSSQGGRGGRTSSQQPLTHEQLIASKTNKQEVLSIDGWVPPSIATNLSSRARENDDLESENNQDLYSNSLHARNDEDGKYGEDGLPQVVIDQWSQVEARQVDQQNLLSVQGTALDDSTNHSIQHEVVPPEISEEQNQQEQLEEEQLEESTSENQSSFSQEGLKYF
eukprot:TRINITY_DN3569_c0_g1_i2.p1 TRINITY_DN3569_c0_g1~~TRINITY_DN3569_c0_g1_i2.p1  ORF type:complete len:347 (-),score=64.96 TRINITY_DN3569_c0_g1_i2:600-1640(-)